MADEELNAIADKVAEKLKPKQSTWQVLNYSVIGDEMQVVARSPSGTLYQGIVGQWKEVQAVGGGA